MLPDPAYRFLIGLGYVQLARMRLDQVQVFVEGVVDAAEDLQGEGTGDAADAKQFLGTEQGKGGQGGHGAGAVHQGDPFLEAEPHGRDAQGGEELGGIVEFVPVVRFSLPDDGERQVRQVDQVAGGADAAAFRDVGGDAAVDQLSHEFEQLDPHAAVALDQGVQADGQDGQGDVRLQRVAEPGGMAADQVHLERLDLAVLDDLVAHGPERGVDPVDDPLGGDFLFQETAACPAQFHGSGIEADQLVADADGDDIFDGEVTAVQYDCGAFEHYVSFVAVMGVASYLR